MYTALATIGGIVLLAALMVVYAELGLRRRRCPAFMIRRALRMEVVAKAPFHWCGSIKGDAEKIGKIGSHFTAEMQESCDVRSMWQIVFELGEPPALYSIRISPVGWHFLGEPANCRKLEDAPGIWDYLMSLLPEAKKRWLKAPAASTGVPWPDEWNLPYDLRALVIHANKRTCPVSEMGNASKMDVYTTVPIPRRATVRADQGAPAEIAGHLTDERRDPIGLPGSCLLVFETGAPRQVYALQVSQLGWNFYGEACNCRKLKGNAKDMLEFFTYLESLLPGFDEDDLRKIPVPEEDLSWFDEAKVPEDLRGLVPLAKKWGVGDDLKRSVLILKASPAEKKELEEKVGPRLERIDEFVHSFDSPESMSREAVRFMYLCEAYNGLPPGDTQEATGEERKANGAPKITSRYADTDGVTIDAAKVPGDLRDLVPLARIWAIDDDVERDAFKQAVSFEEKKTLVDKVWPKMARIEEFCAKHHSEVPVPHEIVLFDMMAEAAAEVYYDVYPKRPSGDSTISSLEEIHGLEVREAYPAVIDALEARLKGDPSDKEVVVRLGFNYWLVVAEKERLQVDVPTQEYAKRFMGLFRQYHDRLQDDADFCWTYGLGISLFWYYFPGAVEELGKSLLERAARLDSFWDRMQNEQATREEMAARFEGRGVFVKYYLAE